MTVQWQPSEGIKPTDELMAIITCDKSVSVLAGAGAGKTEVLAQKANYLLQTGKCIWPKRILCLSYKKEAQENIRVRVVSRCGKKSERFDSFTFDAFCKSILDRFKDILPEEKRPDNGYDIVSKPKDCNGKDKLSFDLIRKLSLDILSERGDIANLFSFSYSHVFIDEFQDTRADQYNIIRLLFKDKGTQLLAVGDINQSIMLWANASPTVFQDYCKDFHSESKLLMQNFRANEEIQDVLRCFVHFVQDEINFLPMTRDVENCSVLYYKNEITEADDITKRIERFISSGVKEKEICILTKQLSAQYTQKLRDKLTARGIRNLDMTELQDYLKEPLGKIFSALFKVYSSRSPSGYTELCELYLALHNIERGNEKEELLIRDLSEKISINRMKVGRSSSPDLILSCIKDIIDFFGVKKMTGRWSQYKSKAFWEKLWMNLEHHLRYTISVTNTVAEAAGMFSAENSIQVMNIHKSKGLEYKVVILLGLEDQAFWNYQKAKFENDCAIYVALSRAKEHILVTSSGYREHRLNNGYDNRTSTYAMVKPVYAFLQTSCKFQMIK
ncbi:ATP-dependent helicase [Klebsiella aerogenes]|uniref:ATP-dependent helicase n=1 Tax=Klebsiella aerogenes TaxID=548 RepID=UPI00063CF913|nr:ATP-dependent helicase [Klebsiella aerogenes]KLF55077.1 helicase [Klebsiella aerogenes]MDX7184872.1 ATP-dependent helicase [Klebsiella aerogenes]HCT8363713.1 ATP-dependent helicase [Klebsiella aerogenes]